MVRLVEHQCRTKLSIRLLHLEWKPPLTRYEHVAWHNEGTKYKRACAYSAFDTLVLELKKHGIPNAVAAVLSIVY